jgi:hypothetical protein
MEAVHSSETLVNLYQTTRGHVTLQRLSLLALKIVRVESAGLTRRKEDNIQGVSSSSNCGMRNCWSLSRYAIQVMVVSMKKNGPCAVTCIKLAVFCYIMTVRNVMSSL